MTTNTNIAETIVGVYLSVPRRLDYTILSGDGTQVLFHNGDESYRVFFEPSSIGHNLFLQYHNEQSILIKKFTQTDVWFYKANEMSIQASAAKPIEVIRKIDCTATYAVPESEPEPAPNRENYLGKWFKRDNVVLHIESLDPDNQDAVYCKYFDLSSPDNEDCICGTMAFSLFKEISTSIKQLLYRRKNGEEVNYIIDTYTELDESEVQYYFKKWIDGLEDYLFGIEQEG